MSILFEIDLPEGVEFISLRQMWDGKWDICLKVSNKVLHLGSSLGIIYGSGSAATPGDALDIALHRLAEQLIIARERKPAVPLAKKHLHQGPTPPTEELLAELGL